MNLRTALSDQIRAIVPQKQRRKFTMARLRSRRASASMRTMPDFLIIGAERGGTSSLYKYLGRHPQIAPSLRKETEYFNRYYGKGENWYRAHFPLSLRRSLAEARGGRLLSFEATPLYLPDPRVPGRVASALPGVKLIVLLRNPVARAVSKWRHYSRLGFEDLGFQEAIDAEQQRIAGEFEHMLADPSYYSRPFLRFSYLEGGKYAEQITRWFEHFDRSRFLFVKSEDFYRDPASTYSDILSFLELRHWLPSSFPMYSSATSTNPAAADAGLPDVFRRSLQQYFVPFNDQLARLLGRDFGWFEGS